MDGDLRDRKPPCSPQRSSLILRHHAHSRMPWAVGVTLRMLRVCHSLLKQQVSDCTVYSCSKYQTSTMSNVQIQEPG
jgi:hypothetical protein